MTEGRRRNQRRMFVIKKDRRRLLLLRSIRGVKINAIANHVARYGVSAFHDYAVAHRLSVWFSSFSRAFRIVKRDRRLIVNQRKTSWKNYRVVGNVGRLKAREFRNSVNKCCVIFANTFNERRANYAVNWIIGGSVNFREGLSQDSRTIANNCDSNRLDLSRGIPARFPRCLLVGFCSRHLFRNKCGGATHSTDTLTNIFG